MTGWFWQDYGFGSTPPILHANGEGKGGLIFVEATIPTEKNPRNLETTESTGGGEGGLILTVCCCYTGLGPWL